jgi:hypothetical protein
MNFDSLLARILIDSPVAGAGPNPFARGALHLLEGTKANDADVALLFDRRNDRLDDRFQHALGLCLAQVMCSSHFPGQLDSIHTIRPPMVEINKIRCLLRWEFHGIVPEKRWVACAVVNKIRTSLKTALRSDSRA